jgi:hypothetical protein
MNLPIDRSYSGTYFQPKQERMFNILNISSGRYGKMTTASFVGASNQHLNVGWSSGD